MIINNFKIIEDFLVFDDKLDFYMCQVIQRKKENPELGSNNKTIKVFYISSLEYFKSKKEDIIKLCEDNNARAYINLNRRSSKEIALELLELLAIRIKNGQFESMHSMYDTVCGQHKSSKDKLWLVDIDYVDLKDPSNAFQEIKNIINFIDSLMPHTPPESKVKLVIPTKNGTHLITSAFNSMEFGNKYPKISLHRNNPTILYQNHKENKPEIKFFYGSSFIGGYHTLEIDGNDVNLGLGFASSENEARKRIKEYLKEKYNLDYTDEQIKFEWNGQM